MKLKTEFVSTEQTTESVVEIVRRDDGTCSLRIEHFIFGESDGGSIVYMTESEAKIVSKMIYRVAFLSEE